MSDTYTVTLAPFTAPKQAVLTPDQVAGQACVRCGSATAGPELAAVGVIIPPA